MEVVGFATNDGAGFALLDEAIAEIGAEGEAVIAEEGGEIKLRMRGEFPGVGGGGKEIVSAVELAIFDGVIGDGDIDGDEAGNVRKAVVGGAVESEFVTREFELAIAVEFVLLTMLETVEEAVAVGKFGDEPGVGGRILRAPGGDEIEVAIVGGELEEIVEALMGDVGGGEVDGVVAFADVEGATVDGHGFDGGRNEDVGVRVAVAVRVGGEVVRVEEIADLEELRDGLAMIGGDSGSEILRGFDAAGSGFDGEARERDGSAGAAGVRVEELVVNDDGLRRVGSEGRRRRSDHGDG